MKTDADSEPLTRFRDEAQAIRHAADTQIFHLLCLAACAVTLLFGGTALSKAQSLPFLWPMLLSFAAFGMLAWWVHRSGRVGSGLTWLSSAMVVGIGVVVTMQRGSHAPAAVYGLTTIAVVFIAGRTRLGTGLAVGLTTWTSLVTWASATGQFSIDIPNPLGADNARLLAFVIAVLLIGSAASIAQRRRRRMDRLLEHALNLTEAERDEARRLAERRASTVTEIGHEIRTPMTGIVGATQLLSQLPMTPLQRQLLSIQRESAERLLQLVTAVLDEAKLASGTPRVSHLPYAPRLLCAEATELFAAQAHRKDLEIIWTAEPAVPRLVLGDTMRIRQVLANLVSNAVKFTDHGLIHISLEMAAPARLRIVVGDSGSGVPPDRREAIFERFVSDAPGAERRHSTGLGLPISRQLAQLMGGTVSAESRAQGGSRFTLELPCVPAPPDPADVSSDPVVLAGRLWVVGASAPLQVQMRYLLDELRCDVRFVDELPDVADLARELAADAGPPAGHAVMLDTWQGHGRRVDLLPAALEAARQNRWRLILVNSVDQDAALGVLDTVWQLFRPPRLATLHEALVWAFDGLATPQAEMPALPAASVASLRVLLVDDNPVNQIVGRAMLETLDVSVVVVDGGEAALAAAARESFDVVLMDLQMPGMDGLEAARRLRHAELTQGRPRKPIVAVTGQSLVDVQADCGEAGIDRVLTKPYTVEQLRGALSQRSATTGTERERPL